MTQPIEAYALLSNTRTAALVGRDGNIDWLCLPRYDSPSTFGALLGDEDHGHWTLRPSEAGATMARAYRGDTFTLVTTWTTASGVVEVVDLMPHGDAGRTDVLRRVRGIRGRVDLVQELRIRFGYASTLPWIRQLDEEGAPALLAVAGPDALIVRGPRMRAHDHVHRARFSVVEGETVDIALTWFPSWAPTPAALDADSAVATTEGWWSDWAATCDHDSRQHDAVLRSLLVLRALTHEDTGGIVAAATTSLPEAIGGERNWDYRYVWLRDASLTLEALIHHGFQTEALHWRDWLLRTIAGDPADVQIMYGLAGERDLPERVVASLPGYAASAPVRMGNAAVLQYQADTIGHVMVALHEARVAGIADDRFSWPLQRALLAFAAENWQRPDQGIWEVRGPARHFTHSRVMMWAAFDRAVRAVRDFGLRGDVATWEALRDRLRGEIDAYGVDPARGCFVQHYGGTGVDAALLVLPAVGYCDADDARMLATVAAVETDLMNSGLVHRYRTDTDIDGLPPGEYPFLACSLWLVRQYADSGRIADARALLDRVLALRSDTGLLAEEADPATGALMGNFPQALSHLALVEAADALARAERAAR